MSPTLPPANETVPKRTLDQSSQFRSQGTGSLKTICRPIEADLAAVELLLADRRQNRMEWVDRLLRQTPLTGGKRMRPILLLLSGACTGVLSEMHHRLAAAVELVHTASIVHDDVLDNAQTRRHESTVNAIWDNTTSVLLGDYLFAQAFDIAADTGNAEALKRIARSSGHVCEGEMKQNASAGNLGLTVAEYMEIITLKTADLCKCACGLGALASAADATTVANFESFGQSLGIAFQIIDDVLDLVGEQERVGKTLGTDLATQKMTLPIIHGLRHGDHKTCSALAVQLESQNPDQDAVLILLSTTRSVDYARAAGPPVCRASGRNG